MAIGPVARILAQIIVPVVAVLARAIPAAYGQALNNAKKAGVDASEAAVPVFGKRISRSEALQVLNITLNKKTSRGQQQQQGEQTTATEETLDPILIKKQYERYFEANDVKNGGSFYLQSKIFRANELLLQEFQQQEKQQREESTATNGK